MLEIREKFLDNYSLQISCKYLSNTWSIMYNKESGLLLYI